MLLKMKAVSSILRLIRVRQWSKNMLLFTSLFAAHQFGDISALKKLLVAFFAFSFCASSVYIINDLVDVRVDRNHPIKKFRPIAAGEVNPKVGVALVPLFLTTSMLLGFWVGIEFLSIMFFYFVVTCGYSIWLKRFPLIDCFTLALLYTLRVIAGAVVIKISPSFWLLTFSFFIFLSLANLKRFSELQLQSTAGKLELEGRGYSSSDATLVRTIGICSGFTSSLVLALYVQGEKVTNLYSQPEFIWVAVPLLLFWISWLWAKAEKGQLQIDPLDYALQDKVSFFAGFLIVFCFFLATNGVKF